MTGQCCLVVKSMAFAEVKSCTHDLTSRVTLAIYCSMYAILSFLGLK